MFTLLLTCIGGELSPQVIKGLKSSARHDVRVIGVDAREDAAGRYFVDVFSTVPSGTNAEYVDVMAELVKRHGVNCVLPTSDEEALALSARRELIEGDGCLLACADAGILRTVADKADCYRRLADIGIHVPHHCQVVKMELLWDVLTSFLADHNEAVVKPAAGRGGRGVYVLRRDVEGAYPYQGGREIHCDPVTFRRDYLNELEALLPVVVMQRLVEPVFDVDMLAWQGQPVRIIPRRRVDSALPNEGHTIVDNEDLVKLGRDLIEGFNLSWLYDCDVMYDIDGRPCILEINPRPSGSVAAPIAAGVPLLDDLISVAKGEGVPEVSIPVGRVVVPYKSLAVICG